MARRLEKILNTLDYIIDKYKVDITQPMPVELPIDRGGLAYLFNDLGYKKGVEIGVEGGFYAIVLNRAIPGLSYTGIDPYESYPGLIYHRNPEKWKMLYDMAIENLKPYKGARVLKEFSENAAKRYKQEFDFVYIDGNHDYSYVVADILAWYPKIKPGGILAGHDYKNSERWHPIRVKDAVLHCADLFKVKTWFLTMERTEGKQAQSWLWVVE